MKAVNIYDAKTRFSELVDRAAGGEDVIISRHGRPVARITRLHTAPYSIVSYAWGHKYQQSNQWVIETFAGAMEPGTIVNRDQAQAWLHFKGYEPTTLRLGPLTRLGGRASSANVAFDDHPNEKRFNDRIETVTVDSVFAWMPRVGLGSAPVVLKL